MYKLILKNDILYLPVLPRVAFVNMRIKLSWARTNKVTKGSLYKYFFKIDECFYFSKCPNPAAVFCSPSIGFYFSFAFQAPNGFALVK